MTNPLKGMRYFIDGLSLMATPGIRRFVVIPVLINIVVFTALFALLKHFFVEFNAWFAHFLPAWLQWIAVILWAFFFISFVVMFIYTFVTIANIIAAPFNSMLSEKVEFYLTGVVKPQQTFSANLAAMPRAVWRQLNVFGFYLPRAFCVLLLFLFPLTQPIAAIIWFVFNAWYMALTYVDYPTDNQQIGIDTVHSWLKSHRWLAFGFGGSVLVFSMIPFANFFTIPAAVAGATKLWVENKK